ncbi:hypothetical protein SDC9_142433 [bioreactor metagenome]|uniref:Uncharacterized protein n=1 Tax=bioreactor metagenome TaxID=1076179 RepID=A0A645E155_9ZZZZ
MDVGLLRHHEPGAELDAGGAHGQQVGDHLAGADASGDENRNLPVEFEQHLLEQHHARNMSDMAAGFAAFEDEAVGAETDHALGDGDGRGEAEYFGSGGFGGGDFFFFRETAGENDERHFDPGEHLELLLIGRGDGDEVHREIILRQRLDFADLFFEDIAGRVASGETAEAAGVADGGNEFRLRNPGHRTADNRIFHTEKFAAAPQQRVQHRQIFHLFFSVSLIMFLNSLFSRPHRNAAFPAD